MSDDHLRNTVTTYNTIATHYAKHIDSYVPEGDRKLFLSYLNPKSQILDVGCAAGRDSIYFSRLGHSTVGVDLSEKLLSIARRKAPALIFLHDDIRKDLFPDESFDAVWACAVLLHLPRIDVGIVLKKFYRLLKPGGFVYIMVKFGEGEGDVAEKLSQNQSRHFTYFMPDEVEVMLKGAGFAIEKMFTENEKSRGELLRDLVWISAIGRKM